MLSSDGAHAYRLKQRALSNRKNREEGKIRSETGLSFHLLDATLFTRADVRLWFHTLRSITRPTAVEHV